MTDLRDRLDGLARRATDGVELLSPELMIRARRRHRIRFGLGATGVAVLAAVGCVLAFAVVPSPTTTVVNVGPPVGASQPADHLAPLPDTALTPAGWVPVALGAVQVSVPSDWLVEDPNFSCVRGAAGEVFLYGEPASTSGMSCLSTPNAVTLAPSSRAPVPHAVSEEVNSIGVNSGWTKVNSMRTEIVRALGYDIAVSGPLATRVIHTLTRSPLSVVLDSDVSTAPAGWRSVDFGGVRFSVPSEWDVARSAGLAACSGNLTPNTVALATQSAFSESASAAVTCPTPSPFAGDIAGVPAVVLGSGTGISRVGPGARCLKRNGLRLCIDPPPHPNGGLEPGHGLGILTAQVQVPGQRVLDQIEIGLSGDGTTALHIFDSLRTAG